MDQARIENFLDDGWSLIGRLHQWLSQLPQTSNDQVVINGLIRSLQSTWANANDLRILRLARTSLDLEQMLERFCAGSLEFTTQFLEDFTAGVGCLQELLLGLEATREEPQFSNVDAVLRMERHIHEATWGNCENITVAAPENFAETSTPLVAENAAEFSANAILIEPAKSQSEISQIEVAQKSIERTLLKMLEQFVAKLDNTCQQLHARLLTDESPHVTTTSRLEHLAQVTRELVDQMMQQPRHNQPAPFETIEKIPETSPILDEFLPLFVHEESQTIEEEFSELPPTEFAVELDKLEREIAELQPELSIPEHTSSISNPGVIDITSRLGRVLIVEESLFYRHLLGTAVLSTGYAIHTAESMAQGIADLERPNDFMVMIVDAVIPPALIEAIKHCRQQNGIRVIGLTTSANQQSTELEFDDCVPKLHPQKLIGALHRVLDGSSNQIRISA